VARVKLAAGKEVRANVRVLQLLQAAESGPDPAHDGLERVSGRNVGLSKEKREDMEKERNNNGKERKG
jgi:hypothetical protein